MSSLPGAASDLGLTSPQLATRTEGQGEREMGHEQNEDAMEETLGEFHGDFMSISGLFVRS